MRETTKVVRVSCHNIRSFKGEGCQEAARKYAMKLLRTGTLFIKIEEATE